MERIHYNSKGIDIKLGSASKRMNIQTQITSATYPCPGKSNCKPVVWPLVLSDPSWFLRGIAGMINTNNIFGSKNYFHFSFFFPLLCDLFFEGTYFLIPKQDRSTKRLQPCSLGPSLGMQKKSMSPLCILVQVLLGSTKVTHNK